MPIRDKVYDKLKSLGLTDSKEDFFKYYDSDENVRKDVYRRLREDGLRNSEEEFYSAMKPQQAMDEQIKAQSSNEPYTHVYDKDMNLVGGTAYQAQEPYQYKPEVQQHIVQNIPDMFKPKTGNLVDRPAGISATEEPKFDVTNVGKSFADTVNDAYATSNEMGERMNARIGVLAKNVQDPEFQKGQTKAQLRSISDEVSNALQELQSRVEVSKLDKFRPANLQSLPVNPVNQELMPEYTALRKAQRLVEESQNIIEEASKKGNTNFMAGLTRGFWDNLNAEDYTFGADDAAQSAYLYQALDKAERGEVLTKAEETLLDAAAVNMAVQSYYAQDLGKGYGAGSVTAESIPFMLEMAINPISASGKTTAKMLLKYGLKKFAKNKAAKVGARLAGDALAATGMAATTGFGDVLEGTTDRLAKNYKYQLDSEGRLHVEKKDDTMGIGEAFTRSFATRAIENQSEMIFNAFKGVGGFMKGVQDILPGGVNRFFDMLSHNKVADAYRWLKNSKVFRNYLVKDIRNATQIGGLGEEYLEEVYNNLANFAIGEMSWEDVTSLDKNIDTLLGLAPTQVMFGILGLGGAGAMRYQTRRTLEDLQATMNEQQRRELEGLLDMGIDAKETDVRGFIRSVMANQNYTVENKRDLIKAAYYVAKQKGIDEMAEADVVEKVNAEYSLIDSMTDPSTGTYAEVNRLVTNPETGEREAQPGYVVGWIGEGDKRQPIFVADGMENTYENRMVLKPTEWEKESYQEMPAEQVKTVSEEMIREEATQQAEQEAKYAPEVLNAQMQQGVPFDTPNAQIVPVAPMPGGNGWIVEEYALDTNNKVAKTPIVRELTNDEYRDMLQAQLEAKEAIATPMSPMESQESTPMTPMSENVQPVAEGVATEQQAPVIPTKEDGSIDFVSYGKEGTFKTLGDKYGEKMPNKVAVTAKALAEDLKKAQNKLQKAEEAYDNAPIGREQKAEEVRDKAKQELEAIQREANFWAEMDAEIKDAQARRESMLNPQAEVETSTEPMNVDEFVAQQLASGNIVLDKEDYKKETGYGDTEANAMNGGAIKLFGKNGMTIQEAGERLMEMDRENGTNFFDQSDPNAGRDALLSVLASVRSRKELNQYIAENRKSQSAKESEGLRNELEKQVVSANYASLEDYVLQMEAAEMENPFDGIDVAQIDAIFAEAEEEYQQYLNSLENGQGTTSEAAEGSDNVLPEEQSDNTGGTSGIESEGDSERNGEGTPEESEGTHEEGEDVKSPIRERAKDWENKLGVKVNLIESIDQVTNREALRAIQNGQRVTGWFEESTGEVCFYVPYLESENEVDSTYIHEVVAHKGLRGLLGGKFDAFCDEVWESMSAMDKAKYMAYPGVSSIKAETEEETIRKRRRAAADEYIAHLAENIDVTDSVWSQFTELIKKFLKAIGLEPKMTNADIANTIKRSYQRLLEGETGSSVVGEGTRFNAKRVSDRRQEINRLNNTVDQAVSLVTGKDIKEVKAERIEREQKRKEDAAEIYQSVLSGDFNGVTLQKINDYIDDATPLHPYGQRISQRLPQKLERGLHEGARTNAVDALFSRICESAVPASRRASEAGRREIEERKKEALKGWAIATNNWHTDLSDFADEEDFIRQGTDSKVYLAKDGKHVIKVSFGKPEGKRFRPDIDTTALFNSVFRNTAYEIVGYGEFDGKFARILKQPFVDFADKTALNADEREEYMRTLGFEPINESRTAFSNGSIVAADLQKSNILKDAAGNISVIDADMKLHTKDVGGNYTYPPVEADLPEGTRFRVVYHGSGAEFDKFDHSKMGSGAGSQVFGWGTYVSESEKIGRDYADVALKSENRFSYVGKEDVNKWVITDAEQIMHTAGGYEEALKRYGNATLAPGTALEQAVNFLKTTKKEDWEGKRNFYEVEIPDEKRGNYIVWGNNVTDAAAKKVFDGIYGRLVATEEYDNATAKKELRRELNDLKSGYGQGKSGLWKDLYGDVSYYLGSDKEASLFLNSLGYVGIKYPAGTIYQGDYGVAHNYVIFNEDDLKIVEHTRFRTVKDKNELVAVHNISEDNLRKVLNVGGLIMPSIAITKADMGHEGYGEISLLFDKETINPSDRRNKVYGGDAWTPRFPSTTAKINDKVSSKVYKKIKELIDDRSLKDLYSLSAELHADNIERTISDRGVEGYYNKEWMKLAYLLDNGKKVKIPMKMEDYGDMSEKILEMVKEKGLKAYDIMDGGYEFYQNNTDIVEAVKRIEIENKLQSFPEEKRDALEKLLNEKEMTYYRFDSLISSARRMEYDLENGGLKKIIDRAALRESIEKKVKTNNADYNKWVDNLFDGIVEKYGIRNNRDWYTPSGNLRPWEQLYDNATPANILKHMLAENEQGGSGGFFDSNIMGASAETYDSIEEIREKGKKRLRKLEDGEYDEWSNSVAERMSEICNDFLSPSQRKEFGAAIDSKIDITNAVANDKTADGIYKAMKRKYPGFKKEHAKKVEEIVKEIQDFAIGYFEAKPRRIVPLSEVRKAIVPKKTSSDIVEGLKNNGIEVATYKNGDEAARARLIKKESNGIRFRVSNRNQEIFVSNAQKAVEGIKQEKATPQQWLAMIEKNGGLKAGEDKWIGLSEWLKASDAKTLTKDEVLNFINQNKIVIEEVKYGDWDDLDKRINSVRRDYTTQGLTNKQEIALTIPTIEPWNENDEIHFGDAGEGRAVVWMRFGETTIEDKELAEKSKILGSKEWWDMSDEERKAVMDELKELKQNSKPTRVLVIDEIQSKRHQEGREKGYKNGAVIKELNQLIKEAEEKNSLYFKRLKELKSDFGLYTISEEVERDWRDSDSELSALYEKKKSAGKALADFRKEHENDLKGDAVPEAPFEKNWSELAMKRMLRYAAENGFDKVAWTKGEQQAERYNIGGAVSSIDYFLRGDGTYRVETYGTNGYQIQSVPTEFKDGQALAEVFGKELATKMVKDLEEDRVMEEEAVKARKEIREKMLGMDEDSAEYEALLEEFSKQVKVQDKVNEGHKIEGEGLRVGGEGMKAFYDKMLPSFVNKYVKKWGTKVQDIELPNVEEAGRIMHSVDVTDTMKESVMEGQTMFRVVGEPAIDYVSQANDVVEVPRGEVMYTMNNIAPQLYKTSGRFMRQLYKHGTIGRVLKGEYAEIDQIKAKKEYDHAKPILEEYLNELVWMKYQATEAAQEVINDVISDVEYAMQYYKDLSLGKDVWRTNVSPRFRISEYGKHVKEEVDRVTSKYKGKEVMFFDAEMTDEEVAAVAPGYTAADLKPYFNKGTLGGYSSRLGKISIFADNNPVYDVEDTIFHENLHAFLSNNKDIVEAFADKALSRFPNNVKSLQEKGYSDKEIPEELLVRLTAKAMSYGIFDDVRYNLPEGEFDKLKEFLKQFGYDYREEVKSRLLEEGRRGTPTLLGGEEIHETRGVRQDTGGQTEEKRTRKEQLGKLLDQVADMGLEGVLGNKEYTSAMVDIYKALPNEVRAELADDALRNYGGSVSPAVSDYLNVKAEPSVWDKVVTIVREALRKVGFGLDLNANEVRYMVWRSKKPLDRNNLLEVAEDIDMKNRLKVGEYDGSPTPDGGGTRFRVANKLQVRDEYEATIKKGGYQAREAVQDAMLSLRKFQELIEKATGEKIRDFENAWMHENRLSSVVQAKIHDMERKFYKPMMDAVKKLMKVANLEQEQVADYLMLKHGIERNREMAVRKALTDSEGKIDRTRLDQWYQDKEAIRNDASLDTWRKKQEAMDNAALNYGADMSRDYSGLTSMFDTDDIEECTNRAYDEVEALETAHPAETEALGKAIKAMTQNTLDESFGSGLMDRKVYNELSKDMYDYYIPLRGFEETTSDEVYAYLDQDRGAFNAPLKRAKGRSSKSDNPIAYLKSIAESGLMQGERNKMKQSFLNLVINHPSDLVSVREGVWVTYNPATGEWEVATPPAIPNDATPADVEAAMEAWEQQMEQAAQNDPTLVKKVAEAADVPYRVVGNKMGQHQIIVKRLGKSYTLTINGNPRLAMALNGQTNPNNTSNDGKVAAFVNNKIGSINRSLAAWYTTRNPDFVASNFMRDTFYTNTIVRAKEGNAYANKFHKNYATVLPKMISLFSKYQKGTLNPADPTEAAFIDFMMNGGETGYSNLKDVEEIKKQIAKELKGNRFAKVEELAEKLDILNRAVENTARFAAYLTSRKVGRSIAKSIFDAKEISVNFNKKGAGGTFFGMTGQTWFGNLAAMVGASGRALYVFFNAAIQGSTNLMHVMKVNPKGTSAGLAAMFLMGAVVPFLFGDDDDEKDYYDLPEHVRRNHLIIPGAGDAWISIPLPIEYRIMYGIGELLTSWRTGHERGTDIARKMLSMTGQALPLNFLEEGLEAFVPSAASPIYQVMTNSSWTGLPIYKENDFNKDDPEYTKAYSNVDRNLLKFTKALYEWTFDEENQEEGIDLNPAIIETLAKGYFGGLATQLSNLAKVGGMIAGEQEFDWRNIPIGNRILKTGDERTKEKRVNNEYFENMEKLDFLQSRERRLKKTEKGVAVPEADKFNAQKDLETMQGTEIYKKYQEFKELKKKVDKIRKTMKEKGSTPEREKQLMEAQEAANKAVR